MREAWADAPVVFVDVPRCPLCGATGYDKVRTEANGDGTATKKVRCRGCARRYKIVGELPETGSAEVDTL